MRSYPLLPADAHVECRDIARDTMIYPDVRRLVHEKITRRIADFIAHHKLEQRPSHVGAEYTEYRLSLIVMSPEDFWRTVEEYALRASMDRPLRYPPPDATRPAPAQDPKEPA